MEPCSNSLWLKQITAFFRHYSAFSHLTGWTTSQNRLSGEIRRFHRNLWRGKKVFRKAVTSNTVPNSVTATGQPSPRSLTSMHEDEEPSDLDMWEVEIYLLFNYHIRRQMIK